MPEHEAIEELRRRIAELEDERKSIDKALDLEGYVYADGELWVRR